MSSILRCLYWISRKAQSRPLFPTHPLPTELWRHIFMLATRSFEMDGSEDDFLPVNTSSCIPFYSSPNRVAYRNVSRAVSRLTKRRLCLVSRYWYSVAVEFLYEEIRINAANNSTLIANLSWRGRYVRRIEVAPSLEFVSQHRTFLTILRLCTNVQVIVKPPHVRNDKDGTLFFYSPTGTPSTPPPVSSLVYLEWNNSHRDEDMECLRSLIGEYKLQPEYISFDDVKFPVTVNPMINGNIFGNVKIFRCVNNELHNLINRAFSANCFTSVTHLITNATSMVQRPNIMEMLGKQLLFLEFEFHFEEGLVSVDARTVLELCPNLQELSFGWNVSLFRLSTEVGVSAHPLKRIHIEGPRVPDEQFDRMDRLRRNLGPFLQTRVCPELRTLTLHGWMGLFEDQEAVYWNRSMKEKGITVELV